MNSRSAQFAMAIFFAALLFSPLCKCTRANDDAATPAFANVPYDSWLAETPQEQIPWKVSFASRGLSVFERLLASVQVDVPAPELLKRRDHGQLVVLLELHDSTGRSFKSHAAIDLAVANDAARKGTVTCRFDALVLPGDYRATLVLYDAQTKDHSVAERPLHVEPLKKDPLDGTWSDFPSVEFLPDPGSADAWFLPAAVGHFRLAAEARRPVNVQLLMNLAESQTNPHFHTEVHRSHFHLEALVPAFKMLSEISVPNGSLDAAALDLTRRRVVFEQTTPPELDWPRLKGALAAADPNVIDVKALEGRKDNAAFFRDEIARRMAAPAVASVPASGAAASAPESTRVFIILSPPLEFDSGTDLHPIEKEDCACRIFYIRYRPSHGEGLIDPANQDDRVHGRIGGVQGGQLGHHGDWGGPSPPIHPDYLEGVLKPLHPRLYEVNTPMEFRKAVAAILHEIAEL